jgi:PAS domain-containing protein
MPNSKSSDSLKNLNRSQGALTTERRKTEEVSLAASQYARSLLEASLDPLVTISAEGKITDVNIATEQVTGVRGVGNY